MTTSIQPADPRARRRAIVLLILAVAVGTLVISGAERGMGSFVEWLRQDPARLRRWVPVVLIGIMGLVLLPPAATAAYLARLANRVVCHERFPPPGVSVIRDTQILEGSAARRLGGRLRWAAWGMAGLGAIMGILLWRILRVLWDGLAA